MVQVGTKHGTLCRIMHAGNEKFISGGALNNNKAVKAQLYAVEVEPLTARPSRSTGSAVQREAKYWAAPPPPGAESPPHMSACLSPTCASSRSSRTGLGGGSDTIQCKGRQAGRNCPPLHDGHGHISVRILDSLPDPEVLLAVSLAFLQPDVAHRQGSTEGSGWSARGRDRANRQIRIC